MDLPGADPPGSDGPGVRSASPDPSDPTAASGLPAPRPVASGPLDRATALRLLARAGALLEDGEFGDAAAYYQRVIGFADPAVTADALLGLGEALYRLDREAAALQTWQSILALPETPATYQAWRKIAAGRVRDGDLQGAMQAYREADRRAPPSDKAEIASRLGWLSKETGDRRAAGRYFSRSRGDGFPITASTAVLAVTVAISILAMLPTGAGLTRQLELDKVAIAAGQWWRLLSVTLLHAGLLHLGFNMYALYLTAPIVERQYGSRWFVLMYILCAAGGSVATFALGPGRLAVGASGAIFGLFGVLIAATRTHRPILDRQARQIVPQLGSIVLINLVLGFVIPGIDNLAHLGGLVTGLWLGYVIRPGRARTLPSMWQQTGEVEDGFRQAVLRAIGVTVLVALLAAGMVLGTSRWRAPAATRGSLDQAGIGMTRVAESNPGAARSAEGGR